MEHEQFDNDENTYLGFDFRIIKIPSMIMAGITCNSITHIKKLYLHFVIVICGNQTIFAAGVIQRQFLIPVSDNVIREIEKYLCEELL